MDSLEAEVRALSEKFLLMAVDYGLDILGAIAILIVGWWLAGRAERATVLALERAPQLDAVVRRFAGSLVRYAVLAITIVAVLSQFGIETTSIIAVFGAAGLAIGLALQGTLQNIAAGLMLLLLRPFRAGDYIEADGIDGTVEGIGFFTSELTTFDGVYLSVPNAQLWNRSIRNYSRNPTRRLDVAVGISYDDDIGRAMGVLREFLEGDGRVLDKPASQVMVTGLSDSSVDLNMRCWTRAQDYWPLRFDLNRAAKERLDDAGITLPFPQRDVHVHQAG